MPEQCQKKENASMPDAEKKPDLQFLAKFVPSRELAALKVNMEGEEKEFFISMLNELERRIRNMPPLGSEENLDAPVLLHYFLGGCDWWLSSLDPEDMIAFGYTVLNRNWENAEFGDVWLPEIIDLKIGPFQVELDLYWNPETSLRDVMAKNPYA